MHTRMRRRVDSLIEVVFPFQVFLQPFLSIVHKFKWLYLNSLSTLR